MHEVWKISGRVGSFSVPLIHFSHKTLEEFIVKIRKYSEIRAEELYEEGVTSSYLSILFLPLGKLLQNYFYKLGVLDGLRGLIAAVVMSFYTFLVRAQLWLLWHEESNTKK